MNFYGRPAAGDPEHRRLVETRDGRANWRRWGPYLADRQWGTVREDYSADGDAWGDLPHDHARSRAYRWGEDGLLGISDERGRLYFALALWNGRDPILKERLFGLTGPEGNHGEDVKEVYAHLDATPTGSYLKALYRYPQGAFPYADLVAENARRGRDGPEYELADTGDPRRGPLLRRRRRVRQGRPRGHRHPDRRHEPRPGDGDAPPAADAVVPQHLVVGSRPGAALDRPATRTAGTGRPCSRRTARMGDYRLAIDREATVAVHRQRDQHGTAVRGAQRDAVRQGRLPCGDRRGPRRRRRTRPAPGRRPPPTSSSELAPGATETVRLRLARAVGDDAVLGRRHGPRRPADRGGRVLRPALGRPDR